VLCVCVNDAVVHVAVTRDGARILTS
jgi:hypothetical protein